MKKVIPLLVLAFVCSSCGDLLSPKPLSEITTGNFYETEDDIGQAVSGVYAGMKSWPVDIYLLLSEVRSKNYVEVITAAQRDWAGITSFRLLPSTNIVGVVWGDLYEMVNRANTILEEIDGITFDDPALKARYTAEVRFLRALAYFQLVRLYGRVPLVTSTITPEEGNEIGQSEPEEVYNFIVSEMEEAAGQLPAEYTGNDMGRVTRWAAKGILARVYLTMAGASIGQGNLNSAKSHLEDIIAQEGSYVVFEESYADLFSYANENEYFIFGIQFVSGGSGAGTPLPAYVVPRGLGLSNGLNRPIISASRLALTEDLLNSYAPEDQRFDVTIDTVYVTAPDPEAEPGTPAAEPDTVVTRYFEKFLPSESVLESGLGITDRYDWPVNFPVLRYADVLLMYAEVLTRQAGAPTSQAVAFFNRIRERAGLDPIRPATKQEWERALERERRHEFADEGRYWFYLIRTNQAVSTMNEWFQETGQSIRITEGNLVYPIPQTEIDIYPGLYEQNPAYR